MPYGICSLSVVPMRLEPSDRSEMVNQVIFGESFQLIERRKKWSKVRLAHDQYEGWLDNKQFDLIEEQFYKDIQAIPARITAEMIEIIAEPADNQFFPVLIGSLLPNPDPKHQKGAWIGKRKFEFDGVSTLGKRSREELVNFAYQYIGAPYLWGGRTPFGLDCSGFTQMVYRLAGYTIPRDSPQQATRGLTLSFIEESEPGDLAFFDNQEGQIVHVGIILEDNYIIHASGKVRLDRLDQTGIFNPETGEHTHKLRVIKKII